MRVCIEFDPKKPYIDVPLDINNTIMLRLYPKMVNGVWNYNCTDNYPTNIIKEGRFYINEKISAILILKSI